MLRRFRLILHTFNKYRLDVGLVYFLLALLYFREFTTLPPIHTLMMAGVLMFRMMTVYLFNKITDRVEDEISQPKEVLHLVHIRAVKIVLVGLAFAPIMLLWLIDGPILLYLITLPIAYLYGLPLTQSGFRIKQVTFVKNIYSAVIDWIGPLGLFILAAPHQSFIEPQLIQSLIYAASLILAYELTWDIRDIVGDQVAGVKTVPVIFGESVAKVVALVSILLGLSLYWPQPPAYFLTNSLYVVGGVILARESNPRWYFHTLLYGQSIFLVLFITN